MKALRRGVFILRAEYVLDFVYATDRNQNLHWGFGGVWDRWDYHGPWRIRARRHQYSSSVGAFKGISALDLRDSAVIRPKRGWQVPKR